MSLLDKIKSAFSSGPSLEELNQVPLMNEKWLYVWFEFPFPDSLFSQLSEVFFKENPSRDEVIIGFIVPKIGELGDIKRLACSVDVRTDPPTALLRFPDRSKGDEELEGKIIYKADTDEQEYRFTPIEDIKHREDFHAIEYTLLTIFGLEKLQTRDMTLFYLDEGVPMVRRTDNIQFFCYPFEKRVKLFSKHKKAEEKLSEDLFGESFGNFIDFVMEKETTNKTMKMYCSEVRDILGEYNINPEEL